MFVSRKCSHDDATDEAKYYTIPTTTTPACSKTWRTRCQVLAEVEVEFIIKSWYVKPYFPGILLLQFGMVLCWHDKLFLKLIIPMPYFYFCSY